MAMVLLLTAGAKVMTHIAWKQSYMIAVLMSLVATANNIVNQSNHG